MSILSPFTVENFGGAGGNESLGFRNEVKMIMARVKEVGVGMQLTR